MEESETCNADIFTFGSEPSLEVADTLSQCSRKPKIHRLIHLFLKDFEDSAINKKKIAIKGVEKGRGVVADVFPIKAKKAGADSIFVPGVRVESGKIGKTHRLYVFRNGSPVSEGEFAKNLKVFKKEMTEVKRGDECTITVDFGPGFQF
jgi:translation initiation factor IF-2